MVTTTTKALAERVDQTRLAAGIKLLPLAEKTGIPRSTLSRMLKGHTDFEVGQLWAVCREVGLNMADLVADVFEDEAA